MVARIVPVEDREPARLRRVLRHDYVSIDDEVVEAAMNEPDRMLRSLDAIHLATARVLGPDLTGLVTYDDRLATAANDAGIPVVAPRA